MRLRIKLLEGVGFYWAIFSFLVALYLALRGLKRKSLSKSGSLAGFIVTFITMMCGLRYGFTLVAFYLSANRMTKQDAKKKKELEDGYKENGQRDWMQVVANSAVATALCIALARVNKFNDRCFDTAAAPLHTVLLGGFLGHYAACAGDTWASELGIVAVTQPRLVTTGKKVPPGTNGGITLRGTLASFAGGCFIGVCFFIFGLATATDSKLGCSSGRLLPRQVLAIPLAAFAGLFGSLIDSLLGATFQYSGFCEDKKMVVERPGPSVKHITGVDYLGNDAVNFLSILMTACTTALMSYFIF